LQGQKVLENEEITAFVSYKMQDLRHKNEI
jgi:hypothetical protein